MCYVSVFSSPCPLTVTGRLNAVHFPSHMLLMNCTPETLDNRDLRLIGQYVVAVTPLVIAQLVI